MHWEELWDTLVFGTCARQKIDAGSYIHIIIIITIINHSYALHITKQLVFPGGLQKGLQR